MNDANDSMDSLWLIKFENLHSQVAYQEEGDKAKARFWAPYSVCRFISHAEHNGFSPQKINAIRELVSNPEMEKFWLEYRKFILSEISKRYSEDLKKEYSENWEHVLESGFHAMLNERALTLTKIIANIIPPLECDWLKMRKEDKIEARRQVIRDINQLKQSLKRVGFQSESLYDPFAEDIYSNSLNVNVHETLEKTKRIFESVTIGEGLLSRPGQETATRLMLIRMLHKYFKSFFGTSKSEWIAKIVSSVLGEAITSDSVKSSIRVWKNKNK